MNETIWIKLIDNLPAIIAASASVLTAVGVIVVAYLNYRTNKLAKAAVEQGKVAVEQGQANAVKLQTVEASVNGQSEKLLELTRVSSHAEGMKDESDARMARDTPVKVEIVAHPVPVKVVEDENA